MALSSYQRYCLNMQGYSTLSDEAKRQIDLAQRFKPALCAALALAAYLTHSVSLAYAAVIFSYWAAFLPLHPADLVYNVTLRPLLHGPRLDFDPAPRRFACGIAATVLLLGALSWQLGADLLGRILVGLPVVALSALVFADFCSGSFMYWLVVRRRFFRGTA